MAGKLYNDHPNEKTKIGILDDIFRVKNQAMRIVTITNDWNKQDFYSGMLKGRLLSLMSELEIIELNNSIRPFRSLEGAFVIRNILTVYPEGSIHLFLVNQGNKPNVYPLLIGINGQYLLAWEDSVLGLIFDTPPDLCVRITPEVFNDVKKQTKQTDIKVAPSFPELQLFPMMVLAIQSGLPLDELGPNQPELIMQSPWLPVIQDQTISGRVIFIDSYGNAISNISKEVFAQVGQGRKFEIFLISNHYKIDYINTAYLETEPGEMLALFNSASFLEVAIVHGNIASLLGLEPGSTIKVKFYD